MVRQLAFKTRNNILPAASLKQYPTDNITIPLLIFAFEKH